MPTVNVSIAPDDGWVLLATAPKFARVSAVPHTAQFYITAAASLPAATVVGVLCCHHPFKVNVTMTENLYGRVVTPQSDGQKIRLDVFSI